MLKLFWSSRSPFARKVMIAAHEIGIAGEIETIRVAVSPTRLHAEVMRFNPIGRIPTLVLADGAVLFDSAVICEYLDATYGKGALFPARPPERWRVLRLHALADAIMETDILWMDERTRPAGQRSADRIATSRAKIGGALDRIEREADSLSVGAITIGEIGTASALAHLDFRFPDENWRSGRRHLAAWFEAIGKRSSILATAFVDQQ
jgi:glutathione S-transferase